MARIEKQQVDEILKDVVIKVDNKTEEEKDLINSMKNISL